MKQCARCGKLRAEVFLNVCRGCVYLNELIAWRRHRDLCQTIEREREREKKWKIK